MSEKVTGTAATGRAGRRRRTEKASQPKGRSAVIIRDGKVAGRPIVRAWESFTGWYWLATEDTGKGIYFGFVVGHYPEWGYFSAHELEQVGPRVWELPPRAIKWLSKVVER